MGTKIIIPPVSLNKERLFSCKVGYTKYDEMFYRDKIIVVILVLWNRKSFPSQEIK
jgi:hypothetical protein